MAAWFGLPLALGILGRRSRDRWAHGASNHASAAG
jgi:hypothetical protein